MPELIEVEQARQLIAEHALGREVVAVHAPDAWYLKRGLTPRIVRSALTGAELVSARRKGKLLLLDIGAASGPEDGGRVSRLPSERDQVLGLHLGMSGRVLVDDQAAGDPLVYGSNRPVAEWVRFGLRFADGGSLDLRDPRRLGAVELDPDEDRLGPDATELTLAHLRRVVSRSRASVKAVLLDQARVAGLGNLLVDEALWRAGLDPARIAASLDDDEQAGLHRTIRSTLRLLMRRGGSHTGDLMPARLPGAHCPRDGAPLLRRTVGGRTTYSCPRHQY